MASGRRHKSAKPRVVQDTTLLAASYRRSRARVAHETERPRAASVIECVSCCGMPVHSSRDTIDDRFHKQDESRISVSACVGYKGFGARPWPPGRAARSPRTSRKCIHITHWWSLECGRPLGLSLQRYIHCLPRTNIRFYYIFVS